MADDDQKDQVEQQAEEKSETPAQEAEESAPEAPAEEAAPEPEPAAPAQEEPVEEPKKAAKSVSKDLEKIIEQISELSVLELADLVHALEDRFGVSASAPVAVAAAGAASSGPAGSGEPQEEKTTFNVVLTAGGANKIAVIKAVRELVPTLGLKEAKDLVEAAPKPVLEGVGKDSAQEAKTKLTAAGGTVELQ